MAIRVHVGTRNTAKIQALTEELENQNIICEIHSIDGCSGVNSQPRSIEESFCGAKNRAKKSFTSESNFSVGIEDGCYHQDGKLLNICCVCLWDGEYAYYASSSSFQLPSNVQREIETKEVELSTALINSGLSSDNNIGSKGGAISIITRGQLIRKNYTRQAILNLLNTWKWDNDLSR